MPNAESPVLLDIQEAELDSELPELHPSDLNPVLVFQSRLTNISRSLQSLSDLPSYKDYRLTHHLLGLIDTDLRHLLGTCDRVLLLADYLMHKDLAAQTLAGPPPTTSGRLTTRVSKKANCLNLSWDDPEGLQRRQLVLPVKELIEALSGSRRALEIEVAETPRPRKGSDKR